MTAADGGAVRKRALPCRSRAWARRLLGALGMVGALAAAMTAHADPDGNRPASVVTNISVDFANGRITADGTALHCFDVTFFQYRYSTTDGWSSNTNTFSTQSYGWGTQSSDLTGRDYVEVRTVTTADPPHCTTPGRSSAVTFTGTTLATNRAALTNANLNGATLTVTLGSSSTTRTTTSSTGYATFGSGVGASDFELVTSPATPGLSFTVGAVTSGSRTATLTLSTGSSYVNPPASVAVRVRAAAHSGSAALTSKTLPVTPLASLVLTPDSISEDGGVSTVTAALSHPSSAATTLTVAAAAVSPAVSGDFTLSSTTTLTIAAGATVSTGTVTVTAVDNSVGAANKSVTVSATAAGGNGVANPASATLTITDDDYGLNVGSVTGQATEAGGGTATFTVALLTQPSAAVTVAVSSLDAGEGSVNPSSLTFAPSAWNTALTVTVTGVQDTVDDGTVTWDVRLDPSSGDANYNGLDNEDVSVTTTDDDGPPGVTLSLNPTSVAEDGGTATVSARLSHPSGAATTVTVTGVAGAYTAGSDATIVIAAGATANASDTATVAGVNNTTDEPGRTPTVTATVVNDRATADSTTMAVTGATLTLTDDDAAPTVTLSVNPSSIAESGAGNVSTVTAALSHPSSQPTTVTVTAVSGAYTVGTDATIVIAAGETANASDTATVTAVDDTIHQGSSGRSVTVTASPTNGHGAGSVTGASLTLTDNETLPTVALSLAPGSITETGGVSTVTATLSGPSSAAVTVTVAAAAGTGAASGDFTLSTATTLTIAAGATASTGTVTVTANGNTVDSPNKSVTVSGTSAGGNNVANPPNATLTLTDDEATPTAALVLSATSILENGGVSTVTATLSGPSSDAVTLTVTTTAVSPAMQADFTRTGSSLTIAAGATTSTGLVTVTAVANTTDAPNKSVTVAASAAGGNGVADPSGVTLAIPDDDAAPNATLSLDPSSIAEGGAGNVSTVTAVLSHPSSQPSTVTVAAASGLYTVGADATITIAAGSTTAATDTVLVTAVDDTIHTGGRTATVTATLTNGQGAGTVTGATLTLTDNETLPTVELVLTPSSIAEEGGVSTVTATLSGPSSAAVTVTVAAAAGARAAAADFTLSTTTTLTIAAGSTTSAGTVTVTANGNNAASGNKSVTVSGTSAGGNNVANPSDGTLTITDDDTPQVTLSLSPSSVSENGGIATVTAVLDRQSSVAVTVTVAATAVSPATAGDFTLSSATTLTFAANATASAGLVTVTGVNNTTDAPNRSVTVSGTSSDNLNLANNPSSVTLTLTDDDDPPTVTLTANPSSIAESGTGNVSTVTAALSHPSSQPTTVTVTSVVGAYTAGSDAVIVIAAGQTANASDTATVTAADDTIHQGSAGRSVTVTASLANGQGTGSVTGASLTLTDNEAPPTVSLALAPGSIAEEGGVSTVTATLSGPSSEAVTVTVAAAAGTRAAAADFTLSTAATLTIAAGSTTSAGTVTVTANGNNVLSGSKEVTVSGTSAGGNNVANPAAATLTITDDEAPQASLVLTPSPIAENGGVSTVTAVLDRQSSVAVTVTVAAAAVPPATAGDFTLSAATTLTFAANATASTGLVTVTATDNDTDAPDRGVTVSGTASDNLGATNPPPAVTLTVADDEAAPTVVLSVNPTSVAESGAGNVSTVTAVLSHPSSQPTTVTVTGVAGAYAAGSDATIVIAAGQTANASDTATVTAADDNTYQGTAGRSVTVTASPTNGHGAGSVTGAALTLTDNDPRPTASLVLTPDSVSETGGVSTVTAVLTHPTARATILTVSASAGTGASAGDFTLGAARTLTVAAGSTASTGVVTVTAVRDPDPSGNKRVRVSAAASGGLGVADPPAVTLEITDVPYGLVLDPADGVRVTEGGGTATFAVALLTRPSDAVTVAVTVTDGGEGTVEPSALVFTPGNWGTARTVTVTGTDDDIDDGDVAWRVRLDTSSGGDADYDRLEDAYVAVTTTDDDGAPTASLVLVPASIPENGGVSTVTAVLSHPSAAATTVTVAAAPVSPATAGDYTLSMERMLTIAAGATGSTGTVTVAATDNDVDADSSVTVTVSGTAVNDRGVGAAASATLTIEDDDQKGLAFDPAALVAAGGSGSYTAVLTSMPVGTVTVRISTGAAGPTASPSVLTFAPSQWNGPRTVTVTGTVGLEASALRHAGSGGGYRGVAKDLWVAGEAADGSDVGTSGTAGTRTYVVNGQPVTVREAADGLPPGVRVEPPSNLNRPLGMTYTRLDDAQAAAQAVAVAAVGSGYLLGPAEPLVALDIEVPPPVPPGGVRVCLPVTDALRTAADGRELILFHDGERVEGSSQVRSDGRVIEVCADGVASFSPFALGYENRRPEFDGTIPAMVFTVDEAVGPVALPSATPGDGELEYVLSPEPPEGVVRDGFRLSGTPTEEMAATNYTWTVTDDNGDEDVREFTIEVVPAPLAARERLAAINRSILPELARATWGSVTDAVTARLESPGAPGGNVVASGLTGAAEFVRSNESAIEEGTASWRELLGGESFAVGLGSGAPDGGGGSPAVAWGSGDWRRLALDRPALEWSGDLFAAHVGVDAPLGDGLRGGVAASWTEGEIEYADRSGDDGEITGVHTSRLAAVHPYAGWSAPDGSRLWGALGYGEGKVEISDDGIMERFGIQKADSTFMGVAVGASAAPLVLSDGLVVSLKGSGEATRYSVRDNGSQIAAVSVNTRRLRLAAEAGRTWALPDGGTLTPSLEVGGRWDGGDGETGAGMELGGGLEWASDGLSVGARGRALVAHRGAVEEWGVSGSAQLSPGSGGRGWSFALTPRWGASESGLARLWDEGMAGRTPPGAAADKVRLETELGYGFAFRRGAGMMTPHAGFGYEAGGTRRWSLGTRFAFGPDFDVDLGAEREEDDAGPGHSARIDLRLRW